MKPDPSNTGFVSDPVLELLPFRETQPIRVLNRRGSVALLTLWTQTESVLRQLQDLGVDLNVDTTPLAAASQFYGQGMPLLLRNLLFNPQLRTVIVVGADISGSGAALEAVFHKGVEPGEQFGSPMYRIRDTDYWLDPALTPEVLKTWQGKIIRPGGMAEERKGYRVTKLAQVLPEIESYFRAHVLPKQVSKRMRIELPDVSLKYLPSHAAMHDVQAASVLEAWHALLHRTARFGQPGVVGDGSLRRELGPVRAVITHPAMPSQAALADSPIPPALVGQYVRSIQLEIEVGEGEAEQSVEHEVSYTYGDILRRGNFFPDAIAALRSRGMFHFSLWEHHKHKPHRAKPCWIAVTVTRNGDAIDLTARFRAHNLSQAWVPNVCQLVAVQQYLGKECGLAIGRIVVDSLSLTLRPENPIVAAAMNGGTRPQSTGTLAQWKQLVNAVDDWAAAQQLKLHAIDGFHAEDVLAKATRELTGDAYHAITFPLLLGMAIACRASGNHALGDWVACETAHPPIARNAPAIGYSQEGIRLRETLQLLGNASDVKIVCDFHKGISALDWSDVAEMAPPSALADVFMRMAQQHREQPNSRSHIHDAGWPLHPTTLYSRRLEKQLTLNVIADRCSPADALNILHLLHQMAQDGSGSDYSSVVFRTTNAASAIPSVPFPKPPPSLNFQPDPAGHFAISPDPVARKIIIQQRVHGVTIANWEIDASALPQLITELCDGSISIPAHALYVGATLMGALIALNAQPQE